MRLKLHAFNYRIAGFFEGENFHEFHELVAIRENFPSKYLLLETKVTLFKYLKHVTVLFYQVQADRWLTLSHCHELTLLIMQ